MKTTGIDKTRLGPSRPLKITDSFIKTQLLSNNSYQIIYKDKRRTDNKQVRIIIFPCFSILMNKGANCPILEKDC